MTWNDEAILKGLCPACGEKLLSRAVFGTDERGDFDYEGVECPKGHDLEGD